MNEESREFVLTCDGDASPVLVGMKAEGRLDGVLSELMLRQTYRNTGPRPLEVIYTFPLPNHAVLLGFAAELNGMRQQGRIVARQAAEDRYEAALAEGDAPVMLEMADDGLHTANIGNLNPGDEIVLEVRFAQLLRFEQGRLRLSIPTTIAPRYGNPTASGLQPQQVPAMSLDVEYPLDLSVRIGPSFAQARIQCPTHTMAHRAVEGGVELRLAGRAWLDRDVVITVQPEGRQTSLLVRADDAVSEAAPQVLMAAFQLPTAGNSQSTMLKLLVDCSGSMAGERIASARQALQGVLAGLWPEDTVSLTRFGTTVDHPLKPTACTPATIGTVSALIARIEADLGNTNMEFALKQTFALPVMPLNPGGNGRRSPGLHRAVAAATNSRADVLLITDGDIWDAQSVIETAQASGQRVFVIGVGSSPAEGVLRNLAESTGGACEFATPGEALEAAAMRMLGRIRQLRWSRVSIDWGAAPVWQTDLPKGLFGGDSVAVMAGFASHQAQQSVRLMAEDPPGTAIELVRCAAEVPFQGDALSRIAAAHRLRSMEGKTAMQFAVDYQLMSKRTHCILVHERADEDKSADEPELHRVASMLAAGWGGTSTVHASMDMFVGGVSYSARTNAAYSAAPSGVKFCKAAPDPDVDLDIRFCRTELPWALGAPSPKPNDADAKPASLREIATRMGELLSRGEAVEDLAASCADLLLHDDVRQALDKVAVLGAAPGQALLLLAGWIVAHWNLPTLRDASTSIDPHLRCLDAGLIVQSGGIFRNVLGAANPDSWDRPRTRLQRLKSAMGLMAGK